MDLSDKKHWFYARVPKTGSTTIIHMLGPNVNINPRKLNDLKPPPFVNVVDNDSLPMQARDEAFVFASVRNPYDRIISSWRFVSKKGRKNLNCQGRTLIQLLKDPPSLKTGPGFHFTATQSWLLKELAPDLVIRMETFDEDLRKLLTLLGRPVPDEIPVMNCAPAADVHKISFDERRRINEAYAADFEDFGYEMIELKGN